MQQEDIIHLFSFLDASYNKKIYQAGNPDSEAAYNASNIRVMENVIDSDKQIASQRGNISFTTINLARIGIKTSSILNENDGTKKGKYEEFYNALEESMNFVKDQLIDRFEMQGNKKHLNSVLHKAGSLARWRKSKRRRQNS